MRRLLIALIPVLVLSCSPDAADTTTSSVVVSTTATETTAPETTQPNAVTTTSVQATSTTAEGTTTTMEGLAGNWADQPLVVVGYGALGWWDGSSWMYAEEEGALPILGGENYQIVTLGGVFMTVGGPQTIACDNLLDNLGVDLEDEDLLGDEVGPYGVAVSASWEVRPHLVESFTDDGTYAAIARGLLSDAGLDVANPVIKQLYRTDLEGDGTNEILVVVEDIDVESGFFGVAGDYSMIFMQKVVGGSVETLLLGSSVIKGSGDEFLLGYTLGGLGDLSGDRKMEIIVDTRYYEGVGVEVWEYVSDSFGIMPALQTGCGA